MRKTYLAWSGLGLAALVTALGRRTEADEGAAASPLVIDSPAEGMLLGQRKVHVSGHVTGVGVAAGLLTVNGTEARLEGRKFEADVEARGDGPLTIEAVYGEVGFPATRARRVVEIDTTPPDLDVEWPPQRGVEIQADVASIRGWARDPHLVEVLWNGRSTRPEEPGTTAWRFDVPFVLPKGQDVRVEIEAVDAAGNRSAKTVCVMRAVDAVTASPHEAGAVALRLSVVGEVAVADERGSFEKIAGNLATPDAVVQDEVLVSLRHILVARAKDPRLRETDGSSALVLDVHPAPRARWRWIQWVMEVCTDPQVRIYRVRFVPPDREGEPIAQVLPRDRGLFDGFTHDGDDAVIRANLFRLDVDDPAKARTKMKIGSEEWLLPVGRAGDDPAANAALSEARGRTFDSVRARIVELRAAKPEQTGVIGAPPPKGQTVPYEDVWGVMRAFAAAGIAAVQFERALLPLARPRLHGLSDWELEERTIGIGSGAGGAFGSRSRHRDLRGGDGSKKGDDAVEHALRWLAAHQSADGGWEAAGWNAWCDGKPVVADLAGSGKQPYDVGVTGLALLAFLGAGYTHRGDHPFAKVVGNGLQYLKGVQDADGCFGPRASDRYVYNHAIAALAMVEAYGMTGAAICRGSAQKALDFIAIARNPYFAWRYGVRPGDNDTSITGWMATVLKSARLVNEAELRAGRPPPFAYDGLEGVRSWIDKMTDPDSGRGGYQSRGSGPARPPEVVDRFPAERSESMTAVCILLRVFLGESPGSRPEILRGADLCSKLLPTWNPHDGSIDMYYWFYGTLAMFQVGGEQWKRWDEALKKAVVDSQRQDGEYCAYKGSWDPVDPWGPDGGRVYSTAILALCLEGGYRYERVFAR